MSTIADESVATKAEAEAEESALLADKLESMRDKRIHAATDVLLGAHRDGNRWALNDDEYHRFKRAVDDAARYDGLRSTVAAIEGEKRHSAAVVRAEPRIYGSANPENSYFRDLVLSTQYGHPEHGPVEARLKRHGDEVRAEIRLGTAEGRQLHRQYVELVRSHNEDRSRTELRAMSSSSATFAAPAYITDLWASYRSPYRAFADQCFPATLPEHGMQVNVPSFTGPSSVTTQSENTAVSETDPTGALLSADLVTKTGQVTLSQQLFDRGGMKGLSFDEILSRQLKEQLDAQIDAYVLAQALATAGTVTDAASFSLGAFYADLSTAREQSQDTAGNRIRTTHVFSTPDFTGHVLALVDDDHRPIVQPHYDAQPWASLAATGDPKGQAWTGTVLPGGLAWFEDGNIPASGPNTQIVVARPDTVVLFEGEPVPIIFPESYAGTLQVLIGLRSYVAAIARHAAAVQTISGSTYPTTLK
jgi:hypothetical protein